MLYGISLVLTPVVMIITFILFHLKFPASWVHCDRPCGVIASGRLQILSMNTYRRCCLCFAVATIHWWLICQRPYTLLVILLMINNEDVVLYQTAVFQAQWHSHTGIERCLIMSGYKYFSRRSRSALNALQKLQIAVEMYVPAKTARVSRTAKFCILLTDGVEQSAVCCALQ